MIYLLDTNTLSAAINQNQDVIVQIETAFANGHTLAISLITYFEIERGLEIPKYRTKSTRFKAWLTRLEILEMTTNTMEVAARIWQQLRAKGLILEDADTIIAATAICEIAVLVTDNTKHFARIPHLQLENWIERA